jgi:hypothetical protein
MDGLQAEISVALLKHRLVWEHIKQELEILFELKWSLATSSPMSPPRPDWELVGGIL